ncbi:alpha/beta fold hydrolase [Leptolyngbya sp. NIES-2104]|uniref:alpha/beta fold hydrolase n=1 Tax=Leptolyngbya sp. NIES-2104 TaxID=1552121 RepID=UPI0006EC5088|nr:alpha/beta fold hydrolase [Leptolyngbya sp. NIES-2104]GAP98173.1 possible alpha/beta hydrolase superfamily [Leptolyngbya sp. NIES-2104]
MKQLNKTQFYQWNQYRCAYDFHEGQGVPLLLIHPIGVGLSRQFWRRFIDAGQQNSIYNPDLLGCGESDMPRIAYAPIDWAQQLQSFLHRVVKTPAIVIAQGALCPVAIELATIEPTLVKAIVFSGSPAMSLLSRDTSETSHRIAWNLFDSPFGNAFYRYARRSEFLRNFSIRQLFADEAQVDSEWLAMLKQGSNDLESRHAVFAFLSGFWRQDYTERMSKIQQPVLAVFGDKASSISREGKGEKVSDRLNDYLEKFPNCEGVIIPGRNVLPYESTQEFVGSIEGFVRLNT